MAGNIYGYQGVHTPLESVTQGRYSLSDYTSMRTELTSRLIALENQGGFIPTNVEITGYLHMLPGGDGMGEIETTSSITGESLYINSNAQCGSLLCNGSLTAGTSIFGGNVTVNGGSIISGNGSGLTNINDITKLPLTGGSISGNISVGGTIGLIGNAGPGQNNSVVQAGDSLILASNNTQSQNVTLTSWSATNTGLRITPNSVLLGSGGTSTYPSASIKCEGTQVTLTGDTLANGDITVSAPGKFIGDGSLITGVVSTDSTKLPLVGGTLTGALNIQDVTSAPNNPSLYIANSGNGIGVVPSAATAGAYNNIVSTGDSVIYGSTLTLTAGGNPTTGIKIRPDSVLIGNGGTLSGIPTSSVKCSDTTVDVVGLLNATGAITAAGNITATAPSKFLGDGSSLGGVLPTAGGIVAGSLGVGGNFNVIGGSTLSNNLVFDSSDPGQRQINSTFYNYYDNANTPYGAYQGRNYANSAGTLITELEAGGSTLTSINGLNKFVVGESSASFGVPLTISSGDLSVTAPGKFQGDGSALTGVIGTDNTKLPTAGGTVTGSLGVGGNFNVIGTAVFANDITLNSTDPAQRELFATHHNFMDNSSTAGGVYRGRMYANSAGNLITEMNAGVSTELLIGGVSKFGVGPSSAGVAVPFTINSNVNTVNGTGLVVSDPTGQGMRVLTAATGGGAYNNIVSSGDAVVFGAANQPIVLTCQSGTLAGVRISSTSAAIAAGSASLACNGNNIQLTGNLTTAANISVTGSGVFSGNGSGLTGVTSTPSYNYTYYTNANLVSLSSSFLDNVLHIAPGLGAGKSFTFTSRVIGQRFTVIRSAIEAYAYIFYFNTGSLPYRVFQLNGVQANVNAPGVYGEMSYTYAGLQKIRNTYIVVASSDVNYSFDLIEIA